MVLIFTIFVTWHDTFNRLNLNCLGEKQCHRLKQCNSIRKKGRGRPGERVEVWVNAIQGSQSSIYLPICFSSSATSFFSFPCWASVHKTIFKSKTFTQPASLHWRMKGMLSGKLHECQGLKVSIWSFCQKSSPVSLDLNGVLRMHVLQTIREGKALHSRLNMITVSSPSRPFLSLQQSLQNSRK